MYAIHFAYVYKDMGRCLPWIDPMGPGGFTKMYEEQVFVSETFISVVFFFFGGSRF